MSHWTTSSGFFHKFFKEGGRKYQKRKCSLKTSKGEKRWME
nr:MAG TPA: hypothetical protein [Caudoviricetes sp.]